ncbi:MAG: hypothetical protein EA397_15680 [Deltaproteobacteria bacterium]|nr:MAG: hypothetical protein EA397_15680 [Deltaproteobacteria bacterium]
MKRDFLIPALSGIALTTTACSGDGAFVGDWVGSSMTYDSEVYDLPYAYDDGEGYSITAQFYLSNDREGASTLSNKATVNEGGEESVYEYSDTGTWERVEPREYRIDLGEDFILECSVERGELACSPLSEDAVLVFVR